MFTRRLTSSLGLALLMVAASLTNQIHTARAVAAPPDPNRPSVPLVPAAWLQDSNPIGGSGPLDLRYPATPVFAEINALKESMLAAEAAGQAVPGPQITRLETLLGISSTTNPSLQPARPLEDIGRALHSAVALTNQSTGASLAPVVQTSGGGYCSGNWCYANAPVQTSEPTSDPQNLHPTMLNNYPNYGFFANMCGPGSTTETVANWNAGLVQNFSGNHGTGPQGYMLHIADLEMTWDGHTYNSPEHQPVYGTVVSTETSQINYQIGSPFYAQEDYPTASSFANKIYSDVASNSPPDMDVNTSNLPSWGIQGQYHIVAIFGDDDPDKQLKYYDTATSYSSNGNTLGFHYPFQSQITAGGGLVSLIW